MAVIAAPRKKETEKTCTRWRIVVRDPATGKQDWRTVYGSRAAAERAERRMRVAIDDGGYVSSRKSETVTDAVQELLERLATTGRARATIQHAQDIARLYIVPRIGALDVRKVTREVFERRVLVPLQREGRSTDLLRRVTKTMKAVLNRCAKRGIVSANPLAGYVCDLVGSPGRKIERRAFSEAELQAIFAAAGPYRPLLMTAAFTGMRNGELFALRRGDVDLERGVIHVRHSLDHRAVDPETGRQGRLKATKTERSARIVAMPAELVQVLRAHLASHAHEFVFATREGTPMRQDNVPRWWYALLDRAGVPRATLYSLRHSFASLAAASGAPSIAVAQAMGHANSDLVRRVYSHLMESSARDVADRVASRISQAPALRVVQGGRE